MVLALLGPFFEKLVGSQLFLAVVWGHSRFQRPFQGRSARASGALWGLLGYMGLCSFPAQFFPHRG